MSPPPPHPYVVHDLANGVRPPDDPVPALDNCLERDIFNILARYNIRGDRSKLVQAIAQVIGDNRTLAEVSGSTAIAQTTLSTYVRIAKLFLTVCGPCLCTFYYRWP